MTGSTLYRPPFFINVDQKNGPTGRVPMLFVAKGVECSNTAHAYMYIYLIPYSSYAQDATASVILKYIPLCHGLLKKDVNYFWKRMFIFF